MSEQVFQLIKDLNIKASNFYDVLRTPDEKKYNKFSNNLQSCGWPSFINMLWDIIRTPNKVDV